MVNYVMSMLETTKYGNFVVDLSINICAEQLRLNTNKEFRIQPYDNLFRSHLMAIDSKDSGNYEFTLEGQIDYSYTFQNKKTFVKFAILKGTLQVYENQKTFIKYESTIISNSFHNRRWSTLVIACVCSMLIILFLFSPNFLILLMIFLLIFSLFTLLKQVSNPRDKLIEIIHEALVY